MSEPITLRIVGRAVPKGSGTKLANGGFMNGRNPAQSKAIASWEDAVCRAAEAVVLLGHVPYDEPVVIRGWFSFPPVASDPDRLFHQGQPDLDKLQRTTGDALKRAGILKDDSRIFHWDVRKIYATEGQHLGAELTIIPMGDVEAEHRTSRKAARAEARKKARVAS